MFVLEWKGRQAGTMGKTTCRGRKFQISFAGFSNRKRVTQLQSEETNKLRAYFPTRCALHGHRRDQLCSSFSIDAAVCKIASREANVVCLPLQQQVVSGQGFAWVARDGAEGRYGG